MKIHGDIGGMELQLLVLLTIILLYVIFGPLSLATYENCAKYKCIVVVNGSDVCTSEEV